MSVGCPLLFASIRVMRSFSCVVLSWMGAFFLSTAFVMIRSRLGLTRLRLATNVSGCPVRLLGGPQSGEGPARLSLSDSTRNFLPHC